MCLWFFFFWFLSSICFAFDNMKRRSVKLFLAIDSVFRQFSPVAIHWFCMHCSAHIKPIITVINSWKWAHEAFHYYYYNNHRIDSRNAEELLNSKTVLLFHVLHSFITCGMWRGTIVKKMEWKFEVTMGNLIVIFGPLVNPFQASNAVE